MSCHSPTCAPSLRIQPCRCWVFKLRPPCSSSRYCANWTFSTTPLLLTHLNSSEVLVLCLANSGAQLWSWRKQRQECGARVGRGHREGGDPTTLSPQTAVYRILQQKPLEMQTDSSQGSSWVVTSRDRNACLRMGCRPHHQSLAGGLLDCHRASSPGWDVVSQLWRENRVMGQEGGAGWR